jgi:hypothetical protein
VITYIQTKQLSKKIDKTAQKRAKINDWAIMPDLFNLCPGDFSTPLAPGSIWSLLARSADNTRWLPLGDITLDNATIKLIKAGAASA